MLLTDFKDDFTTQGLDWAKWRTLYDGISQPQSGELVFELPPDVNSYQQLISANSFTDSNSYIFAHIVELPQEDLQGGVAMRFVSNSNPDVYYQWYWETGVLYAQYRDGGATSTIWSTVLGDAIPAWWRMERLDTGEVLFSTSSDGSSWTSRATSGVMSPITDGKVLFEVGYWWHEPEPVGRLVIDRFNTVELVNPVRGLVASDFTEFNPGVFPVEKTYGQFWLVDDGGDPANAQIKTNAEGRNELWFNAVDEQVELVRTHLWEKVRNVDFSVDVTFVRPYKGLEAGADNEVPQIAWRWVDNENHYRLHIYREYTLVFRVFQGNFTMIKYIGIGTEYGRTYRWRIQHAFGELVIYRDSGGLGPVTEIVRFRENVLMVAGDVAVRTYMAEVRFGNLLLQPATLIPPLGSGSRIRNRRWGAFVAEDGVTHVQNPQLLYDMEDKLLRKMGIVSFFVDGNAKLWPENHIKDLNFNNLQVGGRNLAITTGALEGRWVSQDGSLATSASSDAMAGYITVTPGEVLTFSRQEGPTSDVHFRWAWFDAEEVFIGRMPDAREEFQWTVPAGAALVRVSWPKGSLPKIERGNKATAWTLAPEDQDPATAPNWFTEANITATRQVGAGRRGEVAVEVTRTNTDAEGDTLYQTNVPVKPNTQYTISGWFKRVNPVDTPIAVLVRRGASVNRTSMLYNNDWTRLSHTFTTGSTATVLDVYFGLRRETGSPALLDSVLIDDVKLEEGPSATPFLSPIQELAAGGRDLLVSYGPDNWKFNDILSGVHDDFYITMAKQLASLPVTSYIRLMPEMNGDWAPWSVEFDPIKNGVDPARDCEAASHEHWHEVWRYIVDLFVANGASRSKVKWQFCVNETDEPRYDHWEKYWPGDDYVDVMSFDAYNWGNGGIHVWRDHKEVFNDAYYRMAGFREGIPMWCAEFSSKESLKDDGGQGFTKIPGLSPVDPNNSKAQWVRALLGDNGFPRLEAFTWFSIDKERDWRMDSTPETLAAFRNSFAGIVPVSEAKLKDLVEFEIYNGSTWVPYFCEAREISVTRGGTFDAVSTRLNVGTLAATLVNAGNPTIDSVIRPNRPVRLVLKESGAVLYTGTLSEAGVAYRDDENTLTSLTASDGVSSLANTMRFGAVTEGGRGFESWHERIARLSESSNTPVNLPVVPPSQTIWTGPVTGGASQWMLALVSPPNANRTLTGDPLKPRYQITRVNSALPVNYAAGSTGTVIFDIPGFEVGREYVVRLPIKSNGRVAFYYMTHVDPGGNGRGPAVYTGGVNGAVLEYYFVAGAAKQSFRIYNAVDVNVGAGGTNNIEDYTLGEMTVALANPNDPYALRDVVYESSLLNHYNMACDSVGARWWVDRDNIVQFRRRVDVTPIEAFFSDVHDDVDPLHVCYTDVSLSFDTRDTVNELTITNHGRKLENGSWVADDVNYAFTDPVSVNEWGPSRAQSEMSLRDPLNVPVKQRAADILSKLSTPATRVETVTFDATNFSNLAAQLDIMSQVKVRRKGHEGVYTVIGITHKMSNRKWLVTLELYRG